MQVPFGEWLPDQPDHLKKGANVATNVYYAQNSYKRFPSLVDYSSNTTVKDSRGAGSFRDNSNTVYNFVATKDTIYKLTSGTFADVGASGTLLSNSYATCTITVTDYSNIATDSTIVLITHAGVSVTFTCQGAGTGTPATNKFFHNESNDTTADNIFTCINAHADFTATNPAANVVTVSRNAVGNSNLTVTSSDTTRLAVTDFVAGNTMKLVGASTASNTAGTNITLVSATGTSIVVAGDITAYDFFMGEQYTFTYTFSQQYMALGDQYASGSRTRIKDGRLQIRNWTVSYNDTSYFQAVVTPVARDASTTTFTGTIVGSGLAGRVNLEDGDYEFAVLSRNEGLIVSLTNDSHLPSNFVNAEWLGYYTKPA